MTLRQWRNLTAALWVFGCSGSDGTTEPPLVELAGPLAGKWVLVSAPMSSTGTATTCIVTATLRLYERLPVGSLPPGVFGNYADGAVTCAGIAAQAPGTIADLTRAGEAVAFELSSVNGTCQATWVADTMSGSCEIQHAFAGVSRTWNGTFSATRASNDPSAPQNLTNVVSAKVPARTAPSD